MTHFRFTRRRLLKQAATFAVLPAYISCGNASQAQPETTTLAIEDIRVRDPFVLADPATQKYYLYTKAKTGFGSGWECHVSPDLKRWSSPIVVFSPPKDFWANRDFWAPEVFHYKEKYYLFGTIYKEGFCRGTQIFISESPLGPFRPHSDRAATPHDWLALDGTLFVEDGKPWIVFCHQWLRIKNGTIEAAPLSDDLKQMTAKPTTLFRGSDGPWVGTWKSGGFLTDGPCLYKHSNGDLLMLWSSFDKKKNYSIGIARSKGGKILGPWTHDAKPLYEKGGHCMIFKTFSNETLLALHAPNTRGKERLKLFRIEEVQDSLRLVEENED